jgi:hypothetical protein
MQDEQSPHGRVPALPANRSSRMLADLSLTTGPKPGVRQDLAPTSIRRDAKAAIRSLCIDIAASAGDRAASKPGTSYRVIPRVRVELELSRGGERPLGRALSQKAVIGISATSDSGGRSQSPRCASTTLAAGASGRLRKQPRRRRYRFRRTEPPRGRSWCGCSCAKGAPALAAFELTRDAVWAAATASAGSTKTAAQPRQTGHLLSPSRDAGEPLVGHRGLCKHASSSRTVRRRTAAHRRRPAVIRRADLSFRVLVPDRRSDAIALVVATALPRDEKPVLAAFELTPTAGLEESRGHLDDVEAGLPDPRGDAAANTGIRSRLVERRRSGRSSLRPAPRGRGGALLIIVHGYPAARSSASVTISVRGLLLNARKPKCS